MELQFEKTELRFLQQIKEEIQTQEQTQELRLPEGMPDIGRILCTWGQILLRSKEWSSGSMGVSGGVMAWVLYEPEEGGYPQTVEAWLPFQMKWELPLTQHDGNIFCTCRIKNVDARSTSARKMIVRSTVNVLGEAYVPEETTVYQPTQLPEDIQILKNKYPVTLACEAGEKTLELDEELTLPISAPKLVKLIRFSLHPELIDRRVMSDKVVYRGMGIVHILYRAEDGELHSWDFEVPFSQYAQLDGEYGPEASTRITPVVTSLEMDDMEDGRLSLKAELAFQYLIFDQKELKLVQDAYSVSRNVEPHAAQLLLPVVSNMPSQLVHAIKNVDSEGIRGADLCFSPWLSQQRYAESQTMQGQFQLLSYDGQGNLQATAATWEEPWESANGCDQSVRKVLTPSGIGQAAFLGTQAELRSDCLAEEYCITQQEFPLLCGLEIGEIKAPDPVRPGLILRRSGKDSLWSIAKSCGSTVDAVMGANQLQNEPEDDRWLLVPVL